LAESSRDRGDKKRLLFLIGQLGLGGSERQLYLVLRYLRRHHFDCTVVVFNPSPYVVLNQALQAIDVRVIALPDACRGVRARSLFLYRLFRALSPQIVHSWSVHDNPYAGLIGWLAGVPVRWGSLRGSISLRSFQALPAVYRWLALYSVSKLIVNSMAIVRELRALGFPSHRVEFLPNCVEINSDQPIPDLSNLGIENRHRVVGMVGNLRRVKNHEMFIDGMAQVLPDYPDVRGLIVGQPIPDESDLSNKLTARIRQHGLEGRVILAGFRSDVPELMRRFSAFTLTSMIEGMPNSILEAMAAACPVVATSVGGVPALVRDGVNGFLVEPNDVASFARVVRALLDDPKMSKQMGLAGQQIARQEFSCERIASRAAELFRTTERLRSASICPLQF
jgi:glycosyltransferase involved in cell wall biosynthesis